MTEDAVWLPTSVCKQEWTYALQCKRPLTLLKRDAKAGLPFQLLNRQYIDFIGSFSQALALLRRKTTGSSLPRAGCVWLEFRLQDARRDLIRAANDQQKARIQAEISLLDEEIARQRERVEHPEAAAQRAGRASNVVLRWSASPQSRRSAQCIPSSSTRRRRALHPTSRTATSRLS